MKISVEKSRHNNMESENFHALEEEEERDTMECPYKRFKFDSDDDEPSFVATIENSNEKDNSIGDNGGNQQETAVPSEVPSEVDVLDETGDVGSENGE